MVAIPECCHNRDCFPFLQVRETIMTSALLRLPLSVPRREKVQRVDAIIAELVSHS